MKKNNFKIEYKVSFGFDPAKDNTPLLIARMISSQDSNVVEFCNSGHGWIENPEIISLWMGSTDGGYFSPPEGNDMPQEFINEWIVKWSKNCHLLCHMTALKQYD